MTSPRRAKREGGDDGGGTTSALTGTASLRGGVLIAIAVLLGVVLLGKGFDSGFLPSAGGDPSDEVATGDGDGDTDEGDGTTTTTAATPDTHAPGEVRVQVLNSTAPVEGSAGTATETLSAAGYNVVGARNSDDRSATATAVYAAPGFEADAAAIATALGVSATPTAMPNPPPPPAPADASVVVVLGPDFTPPG